MWDFCVIFPPKIDRIPIKCKNNSMRKNNVQNAARKRTVKRRKMSPLLKLLCFLLSVVCLGLVAFLGFQLFNLDMLPLTLLLPVLFVVILITLLIIVFSNFKCRRNVSKLVMTLLLAVLATTYGLGNYYVYGLSNLFNEVTNLTDKVVNKVNVYALAGSSMASASDLNGKTLGIVTGLDEQGTKRCIEDLNKKNVEIETAEYSTLSDLLYGLFNEQVDGIILNETYENDIHEQGDYTNFGVMTKRVYETVYYTDRSTSQSESLNAVDSITTTPFTILISGNDSYGSLAQTSRSDVNMLVTIDPSSHRVLMTSLPRDLYVPIACPQGVEDCPDDTLNKLTHTGQYGVEATDETIEKALDITVNYTVRVNFSSLVNLVDAVGGIDVYVEDGLEVDTFYANGTEGVQAGWNHLNGERALAFARERHAYVDGDAQRVKNQQIVLEALINKIISPSMIVNFGSFIDALGGAFETNMPADQIRSFIRYQFAMMPKWQFESFTILGLVSTEYCTIQGDYASVMIPYEEYLQVAKEKIDAVLSGKSSDTVDSPTSDTSLLTLKDYSEYQDQSSTYEDNSTPDTSYQEPSQDYTQNWQVYDTPQYDESVPYQDETTQYDTSTYDPYADISQGY